MNIDSAFDDDALSSAMGTETLVANEGDNSPAGDEFATYSRKGAAISTTRDPISWWGQEDVSSHSLVFSVGLSILYPAQQPPANVREPLAVIRSSLRQKETDLGMVLLRRWSARRRGGIKGLSDGIEGEQNVY
jgi:hypothetical protein